MEFNPNEVSGPTTDASEPETKKVKAAKPPKKQIQKAIQANLKAGDVKIIDIPERRAKRIEEINADMAAYRSAYNTRMHEILVGICDDLDIPKDMIAEYTPDFKSIIVKSDKQSPPPLNP